MHEKEKAIAPLIEPALGVTVQVPTNFNTDAFGTFTRDIDRAGNQLEAARRKAETAMELTGQTLALASEGSFGPHPAFPYLSCDRELVVLIDRQHELEVIGQVLTPETNYSHKVVTNLPAAQAFAQQVGFPQHGLVVITRPEAPSEAEIFKGITSPAALEKAVQHALAITGKAQLETDMRALYNPTRMQAIAQATQDLIAKLLRLCPRCESPGFDLIETVPGLPCEWCGLPTAEVRSQVYGCQKCGHRQTIDFPEGKEKASPAECAYCNP
jgi:DNA-directed RNA polymerase subunit RPC12/RpoP